MWQQNLLNNLLVVGILFGIGLIIYCKVTDKTIGEIINDIKDGFE